MYNLFVTDDVGRWQRGFIVYEWDRVFEYTNKHLIKKYKELDLISRKELKKFPSLFAYEKSKNLNAQIGWITHISSIDGWVQVELELDPYFPPISNSDLIRISNELGFEKWEINRTHWALKDIDLFEILYEEKLIKTKKPRELKVFLCYVSEDKEKAENLRDYLSSYDVKVWFDKKDILPGQNWEVEIQNAIRKSDVVIVCLSNKSVTKEGFAQKELRTAIDIAREKPEGTIFIIPARLENCEVPHSLIEYQWIDLFSEDWQEKIIRSLKKRAADLKIRIRKPYSL